MLFRSVEDVECGGEPLNRHHHTGTTMATSMVASSLKLRGLYKCAVTYLSLQQQFATDKEINRTMGEMGAFGSDWVARLSPRLTR